MVVNIVSERNGITMPTSQIEDHRSGKESHPYPLDDAFNMKVIGGINPTMANGSPFGWPLARSVP